MLSPTLVRGSSSGLGGAAHPPCATKTYDFQLAAFARDRAALHFDRRKKRKPIDIDRALPAPGPTKQGGHGTIIGSQMPAPLHALNSTMIFQKQIFRTLQLRSSGT
jgi:hypothetical protein